MSNNKIEKLTLKRFPDRLTGATQATMHIALCILFLLPAMANAQDPWFGIALPPAVVPHTSPVAIGPRGPAPAIVPAGEAEFPQLRGERIFQDVEHIVSFSYQSLAERELGGDQLWGRVSGFPSSDRTIRWAAKEMERAGIADVRLQTLQQEADASLWIPQQWEVRLLGNNAFGTNSSDVVLETAMALAGSDIPNGELTAPIVYVGKATAAELLHIDVEGKIAIQHVTPQAHLVFERGSAVPAARSLFDRGALAVISLVDQPGNERVRDFSNCGGPCFNLGGRDSWFLTQVMHAAADAGNFDELRMRLQLSSEDYSNLEAINAIGVLPGRSNETVVINAHADAWFDGAGDNADGLAVMLALARHFADKGQTPARTLVFVASAGHHTTGLNGPRNAVLMNPDLFEPAALIINLEHVAQRNIAPARFLFDDGYRQYSADSGEAPIVAGISNESPYLQSLFDRGVARYGTNFMSTNSTMASGEGGGYRIANAPIVTTMQAPPLYHTSGEVSEVISIPGLEKMARFMAFFIDEVAAAELNLIAK